MGTRRKDSSRGFWRRPVVWLVTLALLGGGGGWLLWNAFGNEPSPSASPTPTPSPEVSVVPIPQNPSDVGVPLAEAGCTEVIEPPIQKAVEVGDGEEHPEYSSNPPTSGWHHRSPIPPALYYVPAPPEAMVAAMAKGDVIMWHTGLTYEETQDLHGLFIYFEDEAITGTSGEDLGLKDPIVMTAWGKLQRCEEISGEAIATFFETYRGNGPLVES